MTTHLGALEVLGDGQVVGEGEGARAVEGRPGRELDEFLAAADDDLQGARIGQQRQAQVAQLADGPALDRDQPVVDAQVELFGDRVGAQVEQVVARRRDADPRRVQLLERAGRDGQCAVSGRAHDADRDRSIPAGSRDQDLLPGAQARDASDHLDQAVAGGEARLGGR